MKPWGLFGFFFLVWEIGADIIGAQMCKHTWEYNIYDKNRGFIFPTILKVSVWYDNLYSST